MSTPPAAYKYFAFISYSRKDSKAAAWLQKRLEWFRFPVKLVPEERRPPHARYIQPIYRDKTNLPVTDDHYWKNIRLALEESRFLIVLCSPNSAHPRPGAAEHPVDMEVTHFLETHAGDASLVVPVIVSGNVSSEGEDAALCPALRRLRDQRKEPITNRNLPTMVPDADTAVRDAWEQGFVALVSYLLRIERTALGDHIQRETKRQAAVLRRWIAAVVVLACVAIWQSVEARKAELVAVDNAETVRRNASRSHFQTGMEMLRREDSAGCLAHLARAVRIHPGNASAVVRLASLLGQRGWPIPLRVFPQEFPVRQLLIHPDRRRVVIGSSLDSTQEKGVLSAQVWDWRSGRLLAAPFNMHRCELTRLQFSPGADAFVIERDHKGLLLANVLQMPDIGRQAELPLNSTSEPDLVNYRQFRCFSDDGKLALFEEREWLSVRSVTPEGGDGEALVSLFPSTQNPDGMPEEAKARKVLALKGLKQVQDVLCIRFDGRTIMLLLRDQLLLRVNIDSGEEAPVSAFQGQLASPLSWGAFADRRPLMAALDSKGQIQVWDWQNRTQRTGLLKLPDQNVMPATQADEAGTLCFAFDDGALTFSIPGSSEDRVRETMSWYLLFPPADDLQSASWVLLPDDGQLSPAGAFLLRDDGGRAKLIDRATGRRICEPLMHESNVTAKALLDDRLLMTGTELGMARVWTHIPGTLSANPAPEGAESTSPADEQPAVLLAEAADGKKLQARGTPRDYKAWIENRGEKIDLRFPLWEGIYGGRFNAAGSRLIVCGAQGLDGSTPGAMEQGAYVCDAQDGRVISPLLRHDDCWWTNFDPSGQWLVTAGGGYIQFWDARTYSPTGPRLQHPDVEWCEWSPDNHHVLLSIRSDGGFRVWDLKTLSVRKESAWPDLQDGTNDHGESMWRTDSVSFGKSGRRFFQRYHDRMCLWDTETAEALIDPVPCGTAELRLRYEDAIKILGWEFVAADTFEPGVLKTLATLAEAVAGRRVDDAGATEKLESTTGLLREARDSVPAEAATDGVTKLVKEILRREELTAIMDEDDARVKESQLTGQAMYQLTEAAKRVALYPGAESNRQQQVTWAHDRNKLEIIRLRFDEARRLSPTNAPAAIDALVKAWEKRADAVGYMTAFHFGARDPANLVRVKKFLNAVSANKQEAVGEGEVPMERVLQDHAAWRREAGLPIPPAGPQDKESDPGSNSPDMALEGRDGGEPSKPDATGNGDAPNTIPAGRRSQQDHKVISPFPPHAEIDTGGLPSGTLVLDPVSGRVFSIP